MIKYFFFFLAVVLFTSCSSDNATSDDATLDDLYDASVELPCSLENLTVSSTSPTTPMLVVLINYNDINISSSELTWDDKIFGNNEGELNHYYSEISTTKFQFSKATELNGIASVHLNKNHPNKDINDFLFDDAVHPDLASALSALDNNITYSDYDTDGDGHIQADELLITFIVAGYEDAYEGGHTDKGIWAHQNCTLSANTPLLDNNVTIMGCANGGNFALFGERHDANPVNTHDATIGIIAHELGHSAFGLPDLYNTFNPSSGGIGYFGLMGAGTWTYASSSEFAGQTPVHMSAWSKFYNGWTIPDNTLGSKVMNATSLNSYNTLIIENNEKCYLLENRDNTGYDRGLFALTGTFGGGLAIWEIDETKTTSSNIYYNNVNIDTLNKGVDLVEAQAGTIDYGTGGDEDALYYDGNNNSFTTSTANISNISVRSSSMTLDVN